MSLPTGSAVTFLFSDIEASTRLERAIGSAAWPGRFARHAAGLNAPDIALPTDAAASGS